MKELRSELGRLQTDFEYKWSSQMRMVFDVELVHR